MTKSRAITIFVYGKPTFKIKLKLTIVLPMKTQKTVKFGNLSEKCIYFERIKYSIDIKVDLFKTSFIFSN